MKAIYAAGKTQHIIGPADEHCPHLHTWKIAKRYTAQIIGPIRTVFYTCEDCHEALQHEIAQNFILCNDCRKPLQPEEVIGWSPYDHTPGDPTIYLCPECTCGVKHLDRIEYDRAAFLEDMSDRQQALKMSCMSGEAQSLRYIPPVISKSIDNHLGR